MSKFSILTVLAFCCASCISACSDKDSAHIEGYGSGYEQGESRMTNKSSMVPALKSPKPSSKEKPLANVNGRSIYTYELGQSTQLKLYDLEWAKYELTRAALRENIESQVKQQVSEKINITMLMEPPLPPRVSGFDNQNGELIFIQGQPHTGSLEAPIEVSVFCNYQSAHCARMQALYEQLKALYGDLIKYTYYDYPLKYHRYSAIASQAARCADAFGYFEQYRSALWASQDNLNQERLISLAFQIGIKKADFEVCMSDPSIKQKIKDNMQLAQQLGFSNVPVTLINGLYLNGPKSIDVFRFMIDQELKRLELSDKPEKNQSEMNLVKTQLPLVLEAVETGHQQNLNARIRNTVDNSAGRYAQDDEVLEGVYVVLVEAERVIIENNGQLEFLPLISGSNLASIDERLGDESSLEISADPIVSNDEADSDIESEKTSYRNVPEDVLSQDLEYKPRPVIASKGVLPLSKSWVDSQLQNQSSLESGFVAAAHEVEGKHLLKLKDVQESEFYRTLGLQDGDAVMRVNGEWVHEQHNNLFDVLENEEHLSIVIMRKGLPVHLEYAIR